MTNLKNVNIMSDEKYSAATKNQDELYFTPADSYVDSRITSLMDNAGFVKKPNLANYVDIPMTNNTIYTTPADGWLDLNIHANAESGGGSHLEFLTSGATVHASSFYNNGGGGLMFVPKNEQVKLIVESNTSKNLYRFYYTV